MGQVARTVLSICSQVGCEVDFHKVFAWSSMIALKYAFIFGAPIPLAEVVEHSVVPLILGCFPF